MNGKMAFGLFALWLLLVGVAQAAMEEDTFDEAKALIAQEVPCGDLTDDQLELLGDYYMERMHPGEAHEVMDAMMGGEGSESLRQVHINMAKRFYCGDTTAASCPMMGGGMMGGYGGGMMGGGSGMMGNYQAGSAMMSGRSSWGAVNSALFTLLLIALVVLAVFAIVKLAKR